MRLMILVLVLCLLTCLAGAKVPAVGDFVIVVLAPGHEIARYGGYVTEITDIGIGLNPIAAYRDANDGFTYAYKFNNTPNSSVFIMDSAISYFMFGMPEINGTKKISTADIESAYNIV